MGDMPRFSTTVKARVFIYCVREIYDFAIRTACGTVLKSNQFSMCRESQNNVLTAALEKNLFFSPIPYSLPLSCLYL